MKKTFSKILVFIAMGLMCLDASAKSKKKAAEEEQTKDAAPVAAEKNMYKGEGLVIAVPAPELSNGGKDDSWIPQYFQDSITGKFAQFSKMTVVDRKNESMIKIEQELSESGFYSEVSIVQIGQMTNAQLVTVGSIQKISDTYEVNFRVNDATTNEIKASANSRYSLTDMQSGKAVNETVQSLLEGLGIGLTNAEKNELAKVNQVKNSSTLNLAVGAAAEKSGNTIDALAAYLAAENDNATSEEAKSSISNILGDKPVSTLNLKAQLNYSKEQIARWRKIFTDLDAYLNKNLPILVYDFSKTTAVPKPNENAVLFNIAPGVKIVPDRKALLVCQRIMEEWDKFAGDTEQNPWVNDVREYNWIGASPKRVLLDGFVDVTDGGKLMSWYTVYVGHFAFNIGFYDDNGHCIGESDKKIIVDYPLCGIKETENIKNSDYYINIDSTDKAYFNATEYKGKEISFPVDNLPDEGNLTYKISKVFLLDNRASWKYMDKQLWVVESYSLERFAGSDYASYYNIPFAGRIMSVDEYNEWLKNQ